MGGGAKHSLNRLPRRSGDMNVARRWGGESKELVESVALRACGSEGEHTLERDGIVGGRRGAGHCALATWAWLARRGRG
jgi:hypothetical protein